MNKKQTKSMMTKKKIAEAAKHLFIQKGYAATSIENISEATGVSKGNIYYHFDNKEGLFIYVLDEWEKEWMEQWEEQKSSIPLQLNSCMELQSILLSMIITILLRM